MLPGDQHQSPSTWLNCTLINSPSLNRRQTTTSTPLPAGGTVFVRQGVLLQVVRARSRLSSFAARGSSALHYSGAIAANQTGGVAAAVAAAAASQQAHHLGGGLSSIFSTLSSNPFGATDTAATAAGSHAHVARSHSGSAASVQANAAQQADSSSASGWQQAPAWGEPPAQLAYGAPTKELVRQCFLFTNHLLLCTRTKDGKLRLLDVSIRLYYAAIHFPILVQKSPKRPRPSLR